MHAKKGQVEISFNWIFILIAGGAILLFFIFVIFNQTDNAGNQIDIKLTQRMDALLSAIEQNPSAVKDIGLFRTELSFECLDDTIHEFYVQGSSNRETLDTQLIFSPEQVGNANIIAWNLDFDVPYPVSSMLLLSDDKTLYVFSDSLPSLIYDRFPKEFSKQKISRNDFLDALDSKGFRKYVVVVERDANNLKFANFLKEKGKLTVVVIPNINSVVDKTLNGEIKFYEYESGVNDNTLDPVGKANFVTLQMLYGAIVSGDPDLYKCTTNKVLERTKFADEINLKKMEMMEKKYSLVTSSICSTLYYTTQTEITTKKQAIETFHELAGRTDFADSMQKLIDINTEMLSSSCPLLY